MVALVSVVYLPEDPGDVPWASVLVAFGGAVAVAWLLRELARPKTPTARELTARFAAVGVMSGFPPPLPPSKSSRSCSTESWPEKRP